MRRLYVCPAGVLVQSVSGSDRRYHDLFTGGAHYVDLEGGMVLLCCGDFSRPDEEALWHAHPEVARLQHPVRESSMMLAELSHEKQQHKKFSLRHKKALASIGIDETHTVKEISDIASKLHPLVSLGEEY